MTHDPLNTKDWQQSDNMAFLLQETGDRRCPTENAFCLQVDSAHRSDQEGERRIAKQICKALNSPVADAWRSERPEAGDWWVSFHPDNRDGCKKPVYEVWVTGAGEVITRTNCVHRLKDAIVTGALWQRRTVPRDPFVKGGGE